MRLQSVQQESEVNLYCCVEYPEQDRNRHYTLEIYLGEKKSFQVGLPGFFAESAGSVWLSRIGRVKYV